MFDNQKCMIELDFHFFKICTGKYAVHVEYNGKMIDNIAGFKTMAAAKKYAEKEFGYCDKKKLEKLIDEYYNIHRFDCRLPELFELIAPGVLAEYLADKIQD